MRASWRQWIWVLSVHSLFFCPGALAGTQLQDLATLTDAVAGFIKIELGPEVSVHLDRLDPRLKLPQCSQGLAIAAMGKPIALGQNTLAVRCEGERPWMVYVGARVGRATPVLVARQALAIGAAVTAADFDLVERDAAGLRAGTFSSAEGVIGKIIVRPIAAGALLTQQHLESALAVRRGQAVTIRLRGHGIAVAAPGKALANGAIGDRIRVENRNSRRVIEGVVGAEGVIEVAI